MNKLIEIQYRLEKYKEKYPNIIEVWETVIASRMNLIDITLKECNKVIELIENKELEQDMDKNQILFLYLLNISNFFNTT